MARNMDWTDSENTILVADYLNMLCMELEGKPFVKVRHTEKIMPLLNGRSKRSIEEKRMNVSAVMVKFGFPYIAGYKPHDHYQRVPLETAVADGAYRHVKFTSLLQSWSEYAKIESPSKLRYAKMLHEKPEMKALEPPVVEVKPTIKKDYFAEEQRNQAIGELGEQVALDYEKWRLRSAGREDLANKVCWASKEIGDGLGYDILSKFETGADKYVEVKSTTQGKYAPFYFTKNELEFSEQNASSYALYRVYNLRKKPELFIADGFLGSSFHYQPTNYKGWL